MNEGILATRLGLKGWPAAAEESILARDAALAGLTGGRLHICHVSTRGSLDIIRRAKDLGVNVTVEVTPHHLTLTEEAVLGYDTSAKVNPPLRTQKDVDALIAALSDGTIDAIATDHAPHTPAEKVCEFDLAPFGIVGLETALGSLMSLVHAGVLALPTLISKLTVEPARIISRDFGTLNVGAAADVTIFDPDFEWVVNPDEFASKGRNTPLVGKTLKGRVMATIAGGKVVHRDAALRGSQ
jgi:dihydroorotase